MANEKGAIGLQGHPGPVRVTKGHVSCSEARRVFRDLQVGRHSEFPENIGDQTETYVNGWMCDEAHMGISVCLQGSEYNSKTHFEEGKRVIEWEYEPRES